MNPIIFVGLSALIITGVYAVQLGLTQQAELSELQRRLNAEAAAQGAAGGLGGEIHDRRHIIIENPTAYAATILQLRAYDTESGTIVQRWQMPAGSASAVSPYASLNLTDTISAMPDGTKLFELAENHTSYEFRGVSAEGAVFEIVHAQDAGGGPPENTFGHMSAVPAEGGGGTASYAGGVNTYDFFYATDISCRIVNSGKKFTAVWDTAFHTGTGYAISDAKPLGNMWRDGHITSFAPSFITPTCTVDPGPLTPPPADITHHGSHGGFKVYARPISTTPHTVDISLPLSANFTIPSDGKIMVRVDVPVYATTDAAYGSSVDLISAVGSYSGVSYLTIGHRMDDLESRYMAEWTRENAGRSHLTLSADFEVNGAVADSLSPPVESVAAGSRWAEGVAYDKQFSGAKINRNVMTADIFERTAHAGPLAGAAILDVATGDVVRIDGTVRLQYAPSAASGATLETTNARLTLGDPVILVGLMPR